MPSLHTLARTANLMTQDERAELLADGWHPDVVASLHVRGYRPCKPDVVAARSGDFNFSRCMGFVRQTCMPHLHITVENDPLPHVVMERIDSAIHDASYAMGYEAIGGEFMRFFGLCKNHRPAPGVNDLEKRLAAIEAKLANKEAQHA